MHGIPRQLVSPRSLDPEELAEAPPQSLLSRGVSRIEAAVDVVDARLDAGLNWLWERTIGPAINMFHPGEEAAEQDAIQLEGRELPEQQEALQAEEAAEQELPRHVDVPPPRVNRPRCLVRLTQVQPLTHLKNLTADLSKLYTEIELANSYRALVTSADAALKTIEDITPFGLHIEDLEKEEILSRLHGSLHGRDLNATKRIAKELIETRNTLKDYLHKLKGERSCTKEQLREQRVALGLQICHTFEDQGALRNTSNLEGLRGLLPVLSKCLNNAQANEPGVSGYITRAINIDALVTNLLQSGREALHRNVLRPLGIEALRPNPLIRVDIEDVDAPIWERISEDETRYHPERGDRSLLGLIRQAFIFARNKELTAQNVRMLAMAVHWVRNYVDRRDAQGNPTYTGSNREAILQDLSERLNDLARIDDTSSDEAKQQILGDLSRTIRKYPVLIPFLGEQRLPFFGSEESNRPNAAIENIEEARGLYASSQERPEARSSEELDAAIAGETRKIAEISACRTAYETVKYWIGDSSFPSFSEILREADIESFDNYHLTSERMSQLKKVLKSKISSSNLPFWKRWFYWLTLPIFVSFSKATIERTVNNAKDYVKSRLEMSNQSPAEGILPISVLTDLVNDTRCAHERYLNRDCSVQANGSTPMNREEFLQNTLCGSEEAQKNLAEKVNARITADFFVSFHSISNTLDGWSRKLARLSSNTRNRLLEFLSTLITAPARFWLWIVKNVFVKPLVEFPTNFILKKICRIALTRTNIVKDSIEKIGQLFAPNSQNPEVFDRVLLQMLNQIWSELQNAEENSNEENLPPVDPEVKAQMKRCLVALYSTNRITRTHDDASLERALRGDTGENILLREFKALFGDLAGPKIYSAVAETMTRSYQILMRPEKQKAYLLNSIEAACSNLIEEDSSENASRGADLDFGGQIRQARNRNGPALSSTRMAVINTFKAILDKSISKALENIDTSSSASENNRTHLSNLQQRFLGRTKEEILAAQPASNREAPQEEGAGALSGSDRSLSSLDSEAASMESFEDASLESSSSGHSARNGAAAENAAQREIDIFAGFDPDDSSAALEWKRAFESLKETESFSAKMDILLTQIGPGLSEFSDQFLRNLRLLLQENGNSASTQHYQENQEGFSKSILEITKGYYRLRDNLVIGEHRGDLQAYVTRLSRHMNGLKKRFDAFTALSEASNEPLENKITILERIFRNENQRAQGTLVNRVRQLVAAMNREQLAHEERNHLRQIGNGLRSLDQNASEEEVAPLFGRLVDLEIKAGIDHQTRALRDQQREFTGQHEHLAKLQSWKKLQENFNPTMSKCLTSIEGASLYGQLSRNLYETTTLIETLRELNPAEQGSLIRRTKQEIVALRDSITETINHNLDPFTIDRTKVNSIREKEKRLIRRMELAVSTNNRNLGSISLESLETAKDDLQNALKALWLDTPKSNANTSFEDLCGRRRAVETDLNPVEEAQEELLSEDVLLDTILGHIDEAAKQCCDLDASDPFFTGLEETIKSFGGNFAKNNISQFCYKLAKKFRKAYATPLFAQALTQRLISRIYLGT